MIKNYYPRLILIFTIIQYYWHDVQRLGCKLIVRVSIPVYLCSAIISIKFDYAGVIVVLFSELLYIL